MTKSEATTALSGILADVKARQGNVTNDMSLHQFIERIYYPFYRRTACRGNSIRVFWTISAWRLR
jgi:hypothetical protein